jgi:hypothetical protein
LLSCGEPNVNVEAVEYVPKIAVEAFIYPGEEISGIRIMRNFPLEESVKEDDLFLTPQQNNVIVTINGNELEFDPVSKTYFWNAIVDFNTEYTININATIREKALYATAKTTTPGPGFDLMQNELGTFSYSDALPAIEFTTSSTTDFYIFSVIADSNSTDNFIYDNRINPGIEKSDVEDRMSSFLLQSRWLSHLDPDYSGTYTYQVEDFDVWFYANYRVIAYAGDYNFRQFHLTNSQLQEMDGNFHEPFQVFTGDGIGIFGSAIKDTAYFTLTK